MRLGWFVVWLALLAPQKSSVTKAPGEKVTLEIAANSQPARAPAALRWEVTFPAQLMEMEGDAEAGSAAKKSGKSLRCTQRRPYSCSCVLSGSDNPISDGQIAIFHFRVRTTAKSGTAKLRVERAVSTTVESKVVSLNDTESIVIIR